MLATIAVLLNGDSYLQAQSSQTIHGFVGSFRNAKALAVDPDENIYVVDGGTNQVLKLSREGKVLSAVGGFGWTQPAFDQPSDIAAPNGLDVYVADYGNHRIERFDRNLNLVSTLPQISAETAEREFGYPRGVGVSAFGELFITDGENNRIVKYVRNAMERSFGGIEGGSGTLHAPSRVRVGGDDRVYVLDGNTILIFDVFGNYVSALGVDVFRHVINFAIDQDTTYILDGATVYRALPAGSLEMVDTLRNVIDSTPVGHVVDLAVRSNRLFLLTEHAIFIQTIDTPDGMK